MFPRRNDKTPSWRFVFKTGAYAAATKQFMERRGIYGKVFDSS
jgi:hypothetical protein